MELMIKRSVFDLLKVGIGPSSSHTLGPMLMALEFRKKLLEKSLCPESIKVTLLGSLALTGEGHLTPNAILAGLSGLHPVHSQIDAIQNATAEVLRNRGIWFSDHLVERTEEGFVHFEKTLKGLKHPNTARFEAYEGGQAVFSQTWCSIGGGAIEEEERAVCAAQKGASQEKLSMLRIIRECEEAGISLLDWAYAQETLLGGLSREEIHQKLIELWEVMDEAIQRGLATEGMLPGRLRARRRAQQTLKRYEEQSSKLKNAVPALAKANIYALAVSEENAAGGRIITAPTCGACGVVPGVLGMLRDSLELNSSQLADALMVAGLFGSIVVDRASISGAEVGCQGEVGTACAMAAAAAAFLNDGTSSQIESAAEAALEHHLGLTCDPVMGLVQVPCIERNAIAAGTAINSANLALLSDGVHLISFDACVDTMRETGSDMSEKYKETSLGGLATTLC